MLELGHGLAKSCRGSHDVDKTKNYENRYRKIYQAPLVENVWAGIFQVQTEQTPNDFISRSFKS